MAPILSQRQCAKTIELYVILPFIIILFWHSCHSMELCQLKLEQLERLRSEDTPRRLMITHTIGSYCIPSQKNNRSRTENITERTRFSKSRSNDLEDIGQGQRSSHATHLLMLVIICTKYGKNPSRTVDATERTRFSRSRPNDLEDIGQGQRSLYATHPLMVVIICAKYGKNPSRIVDFFFQGQGRKVSRICQNFKSPDSEKNVTRDTPFNDSDHLCQI